MGRFLCLDPRFADAGTAWVDDPSEPDHWGNRTRLADLAHPDAWEWWKRPQKAGAKPEMPPPPPPTQNEQLSLF